MQRLLRPDYLKRFYPSIETSADLRAICFPLYLPNPQKKGEIGHSVGLVALPQHRQLLYLDSFHGGDPLFPMPPGLQNRMSEFLDGVLRLAPGSALYTLEKVARSDRHPPQARGSTSCALFMITLILSYSLHHTLGLKFAKFQDSDMREIRTAMVRTLLTAELPPEKILPRASVPRCKA